MTYGKKFGDMFRKERKEHPSLPIKTVEQIVKDHMRKKK
jgi:hypothetical protein